MPRIVTVAAAQLGPIQKADSREAVVARMIALLEEGKRHGANFIVYPELALTTFFPRWYHADRKEADHWFEREMPNAATQPRRPTATCCASPTARSTRSPTTSCAASSSTRRSRRSSSSSTRSTR